jgi:hypothetical protein
MIQWITDESIEESVHEELQSHGREPAVCEAEFRDKTGRGHRDRGNCYEEMTYDMEQAIVYVLDLRPWTLGVHTRRQQ